jgi:hypothetical protein
MKKGRIDRFYPFFTGEERFQLHLEAVFRGDEAEVRRLLESCTRESYEMTERGYANRCTASKAIVDMLHRVLGPLLAQLEIIEDFREALPYLVSEIYTNEAVLAYRDGHQAGARRAWEAAGKIGDPPEWNERNGDGGDKGPERDRETHSLRNLAERLEKVSGVAFSPLEELERNLLEEALTLWTGFANCCSEECGMEPEKLVKVWFAPMLPEIEKLKGYVGSTELNPEMLEECEAAFKESGVAWCMAGLTIPVG